MKDVYYFSHDSNARHDPKITAMRGVYGAEGYGWYWMLIEMMMESSDYRLDMHSKYTFNAFAMQLQGDAMQIENFVNDCINEYELFKSDGHYFWSESLLRRMEKRKKISQARSKAANKRWSNANASEKDANALQKDTKGDFALQDDAKERKGKESKGKKKESNKDIYSPEFESFWTAYHPDRRIGKKVAWGKWQTAIKSGEDAELIISCAKNYTTQCQKKNTETQYILHPSTFLNKERYKDYLKGGAEGGESKGRTQVLRSGSDQKESEYAFLDENRPIEWECEPDPTIF